MADRVSVSVNDADATPEEKAWRRYFEALCDWSGLRPWPDVTEGNPYVSYRLVLKALFETEFYWTIELDSNRAADAMQNRILWVDKTDPSYAELPIFASPANLFEVLVAMAWRMEEDVMRNTEYGDRSRFWFWSMLANADLLGKTDLQMSGEEYNCLKCKLTDILDRKFSRNGNGGFFEIRDKKVDARQTQLWGLAMMWLSENYYDDSWLK